MGSKIQESARSPLVMSSLSLPSSSPSFNSYSSSSATLADIAARVVRELGHVSDRYEVDYGEEEEEKEQNGAVDKEEDEFEFCLVKREPDVTADEIFNNGQIRPLYYYPVFDTSLLLDAPATTKKNSPAPAAKRMPLGKLFMRETSEEVGAESGTYCLWNPNEKRPPPTTTKTASSRPKKSNSTGSVSKRWNLKDLLNRSNSQGKEQGKSTYRVVLFHPDTPPEKEKTTGGEVERPVVQGLGDRRRSSSSSVLPYKQDMVGFFSNVNGLSRNLHPF